MHLEIRLLGQTVHVPFGSTALEVFKRQGLALGEQLIGVMADFQLKSLREPLLSEAELRPVTLDGSAGHRMYRRSLCFLLEIAVRTLYPEASLRISHSLGGGYLFLCENLEAEARTTKALEDFLRDLVQRDLPIHYRRLSFSRALEIFRAQGQQDTVLLFEQKNDREIPAFQCADFWEPAFFPLAYRTGLLRCFALEFVDRNLLLRFPEKRWPLELAPISPKPMLDKAFEEYRRWAEVQGIPTVARLNQIAQSSEALEFIQASETLHERKLAALADRIADDPAIRLVLIAGPSSAGKTTFTKKLAIHLRTVGLRPRIVGLDDYFVDRDQTPLGSDGQPDFEALEALDLELLNQHLVELLEGREIQAPIYDFKTGRRKEQRRPIRLQKGEILLIEGIHGLNDRLTASVGEGQKFRIFISALTQLSLDRRFRISTTDNRLIRRLVRDYQFRGYSALHTLRMWPSVRRGEDRNIFPFQERAQAVFNSALDYELAVLRTYAIPLLRQVPPSDPQSTHALRLIEFLEHFVPIPAHLVPPYSILREFIGQSAFRY